jgi:hypothetical protein
MKTMHQINLISAWVGMILLFVGLTIVGVLSLGGESFHYLPIELKATVALSIFEGSMGIILFSVSLYYTLKWVHLSTNKKLTKKTLVSPTNSMSYKS